MNMTTTPTTLREAVGSLGFDFDAIGENVRYSADATVTVQSAAAQDGSLFVKCGGDCILAFVPTNKLQRRIYLVRDDEAGRTWDYLRQSGVPMHAIPDHELGQKMGLKHYRPSAILRLVQSA